MFLYQCCCCLRAVTALIIKKRCSGMKLNDIKEWFKKITANKKRLVLWIILLILFPYAAGLFLIWPSNLFKDRMPKVASEPALGTNINL